MSLLQKSLAELIGTYCLVFAGTGAIIANDLAFYEQLPKLFPQSPGMVKLFQSSSEMVEATAKRNSSLQGAYLIMAARALGLDCGPMSGFDGARLDAAFFAGTSIKSNFLIEPGLPLCGK